MYHVSIYLPFYSNEGPYITAFFFQMLDLRNINFKYARMQKCNLSKCNLQGANLEVRKFPHKCLSLSLPSQLLKLYPFLSNHRLSRYSCLHLGSLHPRILFRNFTQSQILNLLNGNSHFVLGLLEDFFE